MKGDSDAANEERKLQKGQDCLLPNSLGLLNEVREIINTFRSSVLVV